MNDIQWDANKTKFNGMRFLVACDESTSLILGNNGEENWQTDRPAGINRSFKLRIWLSHDARSLIGQRELNSPFHEIFIIIVIIFITNCSGASMQCHCEYTIHTHVHKQRKRRQGTIVSRIVKSTLWPLRLRAMLSSWHSEYLRDYLLWVCVCVFVHFCRIKKSPYLCPMRFVTFNFVCEKQYANTFYTCVFSSLLRSEICKRRQKNMALYSLCLCVAWNRRFGAFEIDQRSFSSPLRCMVI